MKQIIIFSALIAVALADGLGGLGAGGKSNSYRQQDDYGNYAFGYDIVDPYGAKNAREEKGDGHGNVVGSYLLKDIDGRVRKVNYVADKYGFRASIDTNEPGTGNKDPAAVALNGLDPAGASVTVQDSGRIVAPQYNLNPVIAQAVPAAGAPVGVPFLDNYIP